MHLVSSSSGSRFSTRRGGHTDGNDFGWSLWVALFVTVVTRASARLNARGENIPPLFRTALQVLAKPACFIHSAYLYTLSYAPSSFSWFYSPDF